MKIELIDAQPKAQILHSLELSVGSCVRDAIIAAQLAFLLEESAARGFGIFGTAVTLDHLLQAGDRVEIYRLLSLDPKARRLLLAKKKKKQRLGRKARRQGNRERAQHKSE